MARTTTVTLGNALRPAREAFLIFLALGVAGVTAVLLAGKNGEREAVESLRKDAINSARAAALVLDPTLHEQVSRSAPMWSDPHKTALRPLIEFHAKYPDVTRVRTFTRQGGQVAVVLDSETIAGDLGMKRPVEPLSIHTPLPPDDPAYDIVSRALQTRESLAAEESVDAFYRVFRPAVVPFGDTGIVETELDVREAERSLSKLKALVLFGVGIAVLAAGGVAILYFNIRTAHLVSETTGGEAAANQLWQEARNHRLVRALGQLVVNRDMRTGVLLWEGDTLQHLGIPVERMPLVFEEWLERVHHEDVDVVRRVTAHATPGNPNYEIDYRARHASGEILWFNERGVISFEQNEEGEYVPTYADSVLVDITSRRQEQEEMSALALIVGLTDNAVCMADADGRIHWTNAAFLRATGFEEMECHGKRLADLLDPAGREGRLSELTIGASAGEGRSEEIRLKRHDGEMYWARVEIQPLRNDLKEISGMVVIQSDMTAAKELEARLLREKDLAEAADHAKSEFLAVMSHEIRTPLNAVLGFTGLLLETDLNAQQRDYIDTIRSSGDSLLHLLNDILEFSKMEATGIELEKSAFPLRGCIEDSIDVLSQVAAAKNVELVMDIDPAVAGDVVGDRARFRQVLINLIGNAVKFTEVGDVVVSAVPIASRGVRIEVRDTGPGISEQDIARLFKPFSQADSSATRKHGGTGLGLAICRRLVSLMGGEIGVRSEPGKGSTFWFEVPLDASASPSQPVNAQGIRVLLAESNGAQRLALSRLLTSWGVHVESCLRGRDALLIAENRRFDVALVDTELPDISGERLADRLRTMPRRNVRGIVLMGSTRNLPALSSGPVENYHRLLKPVRASALAAALFQAAPRALPPRPYFNPPVEEQDESVTGLLVLVADDNAVNRKLAKRLLDGMGYSPHLVANGVECVEAVRQGGFDAVLMDIQMPEMDGLEATRAIRALGSSIPIIAITADAMPDDRARCLDAGMNDYLEKPIKRDALESVLERTTAQKA